RRWRNAGDAGVHPEQLPDQPRPVGPLEPDHLGEQLHQPLLARGVRGGLREPALPPYPDARRGEPQGVWGRSDQELLARSSAAGAPAGPREQREPEPALRPPRQRLGREARALPGKRERALFPALVARHRWGDELRPLRERDPGPPP